MASPSTPVHPARYLAIFLALLVGVYLLVFLTGDKKAEPKLGIDLQGGTRVTLTARTPDGSRPTQDALNQAQQIISSRVNGLGVSGSEVVIDGDNLVITVPGNDSSEARNLGQTARLYIRPVIHVIAAQQAPQPGAQAGPAQGGPPAGPARSAGRPARTAAGGATGARRRGRRCQVPAEQGGAPGRPRQTAPRSPLGAAAASVPSGATAEPRASGSRSEAPGEGPRAAHHRREGVASEHRTADPDPGAAVPGDPLQRGRRPRGQRRSEPAPGDLLDRPLPGVSAGQVDHQRRADQERQFRAWTPSAASTSSQVEFKPDAASTWADFTASHVGTQTAFTLDSQVVSAPQIQEAIPGGNTQITGQFNADKAKELANVLKYGSLPLSFESSEAETVSATLGLTSLRAGLIAGAIGLALVLVYSLLYYRVLGLLTALSLVASGAMVFAILVLLGRYINYTLDLAGIAGLIIGIGTTADSFVVFFERIKDEIREGKSFRSAVPRGWKRARKTIISGNAVTFLAAVVLYVLAIGQVKGFAFTLGLTTILDVVVVFLVTWPLVYLASKSTLLSKPAFNGLGAVQQIARERRVSAMTGRG